ncbi:MAG: dienelactone hydrolase family protein [Chloroflexota bacterium]
MPFVIALHYGGPVSPFYGRGLLEGLVEPGLRQLGAIMVAPDCPGQGWENDVSETAVLSLLDHLADHYPIDPTASLITGYSMGGKGTWYLAARHQARFAAALPMAGVPRPDSASVDWQIPLYAIHGENDELFAVEPTQQVIDSLTARGKSAQLVVLKGVSHFETHRFVSGLETAVSWVQSVFSF